MYKQKFKGQEVKYKKLNSEALPLVKLGKPCLT